MYRYFYDTITNTRKSVEWKVPRNLRAGRWVRGNVYYIIYTYRLFIKAYLYVDSEEYLD